MTRALLVVVALLASCRCGSEPPRALVSSASSCMCPCPCDAPTIDAAPDAAPDAGPSLCPTGKCLVIIDGQSNGIGRGLASNITVRPELRDPFPAVTLAQYLSTSPSVPPVWKTRPFESLQPRLVDMAGTPPGSFGLELSFGRDLANAKPGPSWHLVKVAMGGTSISYHWPVNGDWPSSANNLHHIMVADIDAAIAALGGADVVAVIRVAGEKDSNSASEAAAVAANMAATDADLRARYNPNMISLFNRLSQQAAAGPHKATVRAQQLQYATSCTRCSMIDVDDLAMFDNLHFTADSYVTIGERFVFAFLSVP